MRRITRCVVVSICVLVLAASPRVTLAGCPECYKNFDPATQQVGQIGGPPAPDGSGRRVLNIRIDGSWDVDAQGNSTPGNTNSSIWNAVHGCAGCPVEGAARRWNDATDPSGHRTGYYFQLNQGTSNPDFIIRRQSPSNPSACASVSKTGPPYYINLPPNATGFDADVIAGRIAHELGHRIGLVNDINCLSIMNAGFSGCHRPPEANRIHPEDVRAVNDNMDPSRRQTNCNADYATGGTADDEEEGCPDADGDGLPACNGDCNDSDPNFTFDCSGGGGGYTVDEYYYQPSDYQPQCYDRYVVTYYYDCAGDRCVYRGESWQYVGMYCYSV